MINKKLLFTALALVGLTQMVSAQYVFKYVSKPKKAKQAPSELTAQRGLKDYQIDGRTPYDTVAFLSWNRNPASAKYGLGEWQNLRHVIDSLFDFGTDKNGLFDATNEGATVQVINAMVDDDGLYFNDLDATGYFGYEPGGLGLAHVDYDARPTLWLNNLHGSYGTFLDFFGINEVLVGVAIDGSFEIKDGTTTPLRIDPGTTVNNSLKIEADGDLLFADYPNTRDDGTPTNFYGSQDAGGTLGLYPVTDLPFMDNWLLAASGTGGTESVTDNETVTIAGAGINVATRTGSTVTVTGTEVDGDPNNELQTLNNTSDATSHTATLSNSGGSLQLVEGTGVTLTTSGTALDGIVTIATTVTDTDTDDQNLTIEGAGPTYQVAINDGTDVTIAGAGGITLSETPANTLVITQGAEADGDPANEIQTLDASGVGPTVTLDLSSDATDPTLTGAGIAVVSASGNAITVTATELDGDPANEIQTQDATGTTTVTWDLSGDATDISLTGAGIAAVSRVGNAVTVTATEADGSPTNEIQTLDASGTTQPITWDMSGDASDITLTGSGAAVVSASGNAVTVGVSTEAIQDAVGPMVDPGNTETGITVTYDDAGNMFDFVATDASASNELQTFNSTSTGTSHTVTLSNSGGSILFTEGVGINFLGHTNGLNGAFSIEAADASEINELQTLSASGTTTTYGINLSDGGGTVNLVEGTGVTIDRSGNDLTINSSGGGDSDWLEEGLGTPPNAVNDHMYTGTGDHGFGTTTPDKQIDVANSSASGPAIQMDYTTGTDAGGVMGTFGFAYGNSEKAKIIAQKQTSNANNDAELRFQLMDDGGSMRTALELDYEAGTVADRPRVKMFGGLQQQNWRNVTTTATLDDGDFGIRVTASGQTITLPSLTVTNTEGIGTILIIYNQSAGNITIDPGASTDTVNGSNANITLPTLQSRIFIATFIGASGETDWISFN